MYTRIWRHLHLRSGGRAAAAWGSTVILAFAPVAAAPVARTPPAPCANTGLAPTGADLAQIETATFCLVQRMRLAARLHLLRLNRPLQGVAAGQAHDMVAGDYFGDDGIAGETPIQRILASPYPNGATRVHSAQNIGWATGPLATPAAMVAAWMASPPHRAIILTPGFRDIGVGVTPAAPSSLAQGLEGATYTLELGQRIFAASAARRR